MLHLASVKTKDQILLYFPFKLQALHDNVPNQLLQQKAIQHKFLQLALQSIKRHPPPQQLLISILMGTSVKFLVVTTSTLASFKANEMFKSEDVFF